jgi:hypothetical protein
MPNGVVICRDARRLAALTRGLERGNRQDGGAVHGFPSAQEAVLACQGRLHGWDVLVLSLVGGVDPARELPLLLQAFPGVPVVIDLHYDSPLKAFDLLRRGAYNVFYFDLLRQAKFWEIITRAASGQAPYRTLVRVTRPRRVWAFMSMTFRGDDQNHNDYEFAISPALWRLKLGLERYDDIPRTGPSDLRARIQQYIEQRAALIAQVSTFTLNTVYEIAFAEALNRRAEVEGRAAARKTILFLRRDTGKGVHEIPPVLKGIEYVSYSNMTELAMRLFFGLGGTIDDLSPA